MPDCVSTSPEDDRDYCTILRAAGSRYLAAVMRYHHATDEWRIHTSWGPMKRAEAEAKAQQWAAEYGLEYR